MKITKTHSIVIATLEAGEQFSRARLNQMKFKLLAEGIEGKDGYYQAKVNPIQANDFLNFNTLKEPVLMDGVKITIDPAAEAGIVTLWA